MSVKNLKKFPEFFFRMSTDDENAIRESQKIIMVVFVPFKVGGP